MTSMLCLRRLLSILLLLLSGCGYNLGVVPKRGVKTVAVPVFANQTLRRGFERDLTRAVQNEIKETTPYLLANEDDAQLILLGEIRAIAETVLIEGPDDEVLEGNIQITVAIRLEDAAGNMVPIARRSQAGGLPDGTVFIRDQAEFVLGRGESRDTATREAIGELAERIVQVLAGPPL